MNYNYYTSDELYHYGVKGMKWGVRRYQNKDGSLINAKANYKDAKKAYNKSYNKAYNYSARHPVSQFVSKKKSAKSNQLWDEAASNAEKLRTAKQAYKQAKSLDKTSVKKQLGQTIQNAADKHNQKVQERQASYDKTQKYFGKGGVAIRSVSEYSRKKAVKGMMAKSINAVANSYISNSGPENYKVSRTVDLVRRASINALSVSSASDALRMYSDIGRSYMKG